MSKPVVSVIVPTYNGLSRGFLREAVADVLGQTLRDIELIIVDDGSTEDIAAGLGDFLRDPRVRVVRQVNQGLSAARKTGIDQAAGTYVALLDDDDRWHAGKLAGQVAFIQGHRDPRIGMVFCAVRLIDGRGCVIGARAKDAGGDMFRELILNGNRITAPSAVLIKKEVVDAVGNFNPAMKSLEDLDMWLRIARQYHIYAMPEYWADYRIHADTITARNFAREEEYEEKLYAGILAQDPVLDAAVVRSRMYGRFAIRHSSLGNYTLARKCLVKSRAERFSWKLYALYLATFLPAALLNALKDWRRSIKAAGTGSP